MDARGFEGSSSGAPGAVDASGVVLSPDGVAQLGGDGPAPQRRRRRRLAAALALALAILAATAIALASSGGAPRRAAAGGVPPGDTTASVTRRTLTESSTVDGTLGYGSTLELFDRLGGTFTWLPSVGAVIGRGGTLFKVDQTPVVLMYGGVPAYRTLKQGVSDGPDVAELNRNLVALGFDPYGAISDYEAFGEGTTAAVKRWQDAEGLSQTGKVELGRVVFAPGARRVTAVKVSLGQDPPGPSAAAATAEAPSEPRSEPGSTTPAKPSNPSAPGGESAPKSHTGKPKPKSKSKHHPFGHPAAGKEPASHESTPKASDSSSSPKSKPAEGTGNAEAPKAGEGQGAGEPVLSTTSTQQLVALKVKAEQQQLARLGEQVSVQLPGGGTAAGQITSVGTVASEASSAGGEKGGGGESGESATIPVTITLRRSVPHLDQAPVSVELVKSVRHEVLTVPATALVAVAGGGYAIEALEGQPAPRAAGQHRHVRRRLRRGRRPWRAELAVVESQ